MAQTATDYGAFVIDILARSSKTIDQKDLRQCIGLASSFLVTDTTTNVVSGIVSWSAGFSRLMDVVVALHAIDELELETVNAASKACSECWTAAGAWRGLEDSRSKVREVAGKLKKILDTNGKTYKGEPVYAP